MAQEESQTTDYWLLGMVAAVALVALAGMYTVEKPEYAHYNPTLTGNVALETQQQFVSGADYNNDGFVQGSDVSMLYGYLDGDGCPTHRDCDIDGDGKFTQQDIHALHMKVAFPQIEQLPTDNRIKGDFDGSGILTQRDVRVLESYVEKKKCTGYYACDLNADGELNREDVEYLARLVSPESTSNKGIPRRVRLATALV